jgi:hypothetical protein
MPRFYYPITEIKQFKEPQGRGSCYQQFATGHPHGDGQNRFVVIFDEDIDFRVFERIDALFKRAEHRKDPFSPLVIAERKGSLTVILRGAVPAWLKDADDTASYIAAVSSDGDYWSFYAHEEHEWHEYAGMLCHPAISKAAFLEAIEWSV